MVTGLDPSSVDHVLPVDKADDEAGQVILTVGIEARHLRRFATKQRASIVATPGGDALDDRRRHLG